MPLRIMHVVDNMGMGGLQKGLATIIAEMNPDECEHVICTMRPVKEADLQPYAATRAKLVCLSAEEGALQIQAGALSRKIRQFVPDIVHSRNWSAIEAVLAARWTRCARVIHSEHGFDDSSTGHESWRRPIFRRIAFEAADKVVAVSHQLRDLHSQRTGFPARKIEVIPNGVDIARFRPSATARFSMRQRLGIAPGEFCVGCVGNLTPVKDHMSVLKAVSQLPSRGGHWRVLLVGDGPLLPDLERFADSHPRLRGRVIFVGRRTDVPELLNAMDVFVLSSLTEGMCNSLLEAMATRLPVVVTDTGGNPEVVGEECGPRFRVGRGDELIQHLCLLQDYPELRASFGERAFRRVHEQFSLRAMVLRYERLYDSHRPAAARRLRLMAGA